MADTVPAMLEPGEYVIRKDAAEEIGIDNLDMLNNVDRSSQMYMNHGGLVPQLQHGHSAIDELLAINTLNNQDNVDMTRQSSMMNQHHRRLLPDAQFTPEKDILHFLQSSMSETNPMDEPRRGNSEDKNTIRKLSDEELKKLIPPKEKKYLIPRKNRKWDWRNFNQGGQVESPQDPDPLQIDARMRGDYENVGSIGTPDPKKRLMNDLDSIQSSIALQRFLESRGQDAHVKQKKESGELLNMDSIMEILNSAAQQTAPMFKDSVQGYNNGGTVGYGDQTSDVMTLEDIYSEYGQRPEDASGFQEYDARREGGALADYSRQVGGLQQQGMGMIGQATQQAQSMGGGFAGFGGRQSAVDQTRTQAQRGYQAGVDQAQQNKFETIRGMREGYQADIIGQLAQAESVEGTTSVNNTSAVPVGATGWAAPTSPSNGQAYTFEGRTYKWSGNEWKTASDYDEEEFDNYYGDGI